MWGPSQPAEAFKLTVLTEDTYSDDCWATHKKCSYEIAKIRKVVHPSLAQRAPEVVDFLRRWHLDAATQIELETVFTDFGGDAEKTAVRYLESEQSHWGQFVPAEVAEKIKQAVRDN